MKINKIFTNSAVCENLAELIALAQFYLDCAPAQVGGVVDYLADWFELLAGD